MPGPPPKKPELRQRRNKAVTATALTPTGPTRRYAPRLPKRGLDEQGRQVDWHKMTLAWWRDVWHSPMAAEYLEADRHALFRLAMLIDMYWREPAKDLAAEIRLEQQAFGLTPIDRRRLQWSVEEAETRRRPKTAAAPPADEHEEDPRKILKMAGAR